MFEQQAQHILPAPTMHTLTSLKLPVYMLQLTALDTPAHKDPRQVLPAALGGQVFEQQARHLAGTHDAHAHVLKAASRQLEQRQLCSR